jgi:hypothetical protein
MRNSQLECTPPERRMQADHHAPSGASHLQHGYLSSSPELTPDLRALVDDVLRAAVADARDDDARVARMADRRDPMGELCATARARDVRAETLILAIKDSWRRLPESYGPSRLDAEVRLATVITRCIREYYGPRRP